MLHAMYHTWLPLSTFDHVEHYEFYFAVSHLYGDQGLHTVPINNDENS
jgi:hypothetical protein